MSAHEPIRLGLIGTGLAVELLHWPALRQLTDRYTVTAFTDASPEQASRFADYSGIDPARQVADYRDLLARDDVDAVLITLPIPLLLGTAQDALAAGKDVICEKPTGTDEADAWEFVQLETKYPERTILIAENYFYRDDIRFARSLLDAGAIGDPHLLSWHLAGRLVPRDGSFTGTPWRQRPQYRGGVHLDAGVHNIAQIRMLCGDVSEVHAVTRVANATIDCPSDLALNLVFDNGAVGNYTACYSEIPIPPEPGEMRVYGTGATLVMGGRGPDRVVTVHRADGASTTHVFRDSDGGYRAELQNFAAAVRHGQPVVGTVRQSCTNMLIIVRAMDSADRHEVVSLADAPTEDGGVPLWRPHGADGLFDGLPGRIEVSEKAAS